MLFYYYDRRSTTDVATADKATTDEVTTDGATIDKKDRQKRNRKETEENMSGRYGEKLQKESAQQLTIQRSHGGFSGERKRQVMAYEYQQ
ncbi:MAG: hypothetical protein IJ860_04955 [Eubacterium sp.]|nr:hypothetical protein [Eubacterium sp.]